MNEETELTRLVGRRVMLNSGGPSMTVVDLGQRTGLAMCRWMNAEGVKGEGFFTLEELSFDPRYPFPGHQDAGCLEVDRRRVVTR